MARARGSYPRCRGFKSLPRYLESVEMLGTFFVREKLALSGGGLREDGEVYRTAATCFPVVSGGEYYWFYLDLMYENTFDESQVGITELEFYTADAYYEVWLGKEMQGENIGLDIFTQSDKQYNIVSINNFPYDYHATETISLDEVKSFFKTSTSMSEFSYIDTVLEEQ